MSPTPLVLPCHQGQMGHCTVDPIAEVSLSDLSVVFSFVQGRGDGSGHKLNWCNLPGQVLNIWMGNFSFAPQGTQNLVFSGTQHTWPGSSDTS